MDAVQQGPLELTTPLVCNTNKCTLVDKCIKEVQAAAATAAVVSVGKVNALKQFSDATQRRKHTHTPGVLSITQSVSGPVRCAGKQSGRQEGAAAEELASERESPEVRQLILINLLPSPLRSPSACLSARLPACALSEIVSCEQALAGWLGKPAWRRRVRRSNLA